MNKRQRKRFLNLIKATEEANVANFDMGVYAHSCGAPACVLGNYVARDDLQRSFGLAFDPYRSASPYLVRRNSTIYIASSHPAVARHFGITGGEAYELFAPHGCNEAGKDKDKAIRYLRNFLKRKLMKPFPYRKAPVQPT